MGEYHEAWTLSREAYHMAQRFGNQVIPAWRLLNLGTISFEQGDYDEALRYAQQSHMMFQQIQHRWGPGAAILQIGQILLEQGYLDEAERTFRKGLAIFQASHDIFGETSALFQLGKAHYASGDQTAACERMLTSLNMAHERQYLLNLLRFLGEFGRMLAETISSPSAIEVLSYVAHSPATPYHAKKQAQVVLTR